MSINIADPRYVSGLLRWPSCWRRCSPTYSKQKFEKRRKSVGLVYIEEINIKTTDNINEILRNMSFEVFKTKLKHDLTKRNLLCYI